jgi:Domain of unknown function (DUF4277)
LRQLSSLDFGVDFFASLLGITSKLMARVKGRIDRDGGCHTKIIERRFFISSDFEKIVQKIVLLREDQHKVDAQVKASDRKVSFGKGAQAIILNALGFVGRALYLMPDYMHNNPVDLLIDPIGKVE